MGRTSTYTEARRTALVRQHSTDSRELVLNAMTPALRQKLNTLTRNMADRMTNNLEFYWKLGKLCVEIQDNPEQYLTPEQRAKHENPMVMLEYVLDHQAAATLRKAVAFAEMYDEADFKVLAELRSEQVGRSGWRIQWGHMTFLVSVHDKRLRNRLENQAAEEALAPGELLSLIKAAHGGPRRAGGRPLAVPKTLKGGLGQVLETSRIYVQRANTTWMGDKYHLYDALIEAPASSYTPEVEHGLVSVIEAMDTMAEVSARQRECAVRALAHIRLAGVAAGNGQMAEEPERTASKKTSPQTAIQRAKAAAAH